MAASESLVGGADAVDRRPIPAAMSALLSVEHSLRNVKHRALSWRFLRRFFVSENRDLASQLASYNFL